MSQKFLKKIIAQNQDDVRVISALCSEAKVKLSEIRYLKKNKIFLMQLNRFMWEDVEKGVFRKNKRIRTVLKFENVINVTSKNINRGKKEVFLDFLTIETKQMPDEGYEINLIFSGDSMIKIIAEVIEVTLDDQGSPWNTKARPKHENI